MDILKTEHENILLKETTVHDLPPDQDIETTLIMRHVVKASRALAELDNKAARLPNQDILISNMVLSEARDSSAIENIVTTNDLLYKADVTPEHFLDPMTKEVRDYNKALWLGMRLIKEKLLGEGVFINLVQAIKHNTAGLRKTSGTVIKNIATGEIVHVPPQTEEGIQKKLSNLEKFLYNEEYKEIDPLIKMAVLHYQFECIHPFHDGNGRTGRIINILWLVQEKLLHRPILFLSKYYLDNKAEYYEKLKNVTTNNDWEQWIVYVLKSIEETAKNTSLMIDKILLARNMYKEELQKYFRKIYSADLLDVIFSSPYFRIENFSGVFPVISRQTASKHLNMLCQEYEREDGTKGQLLTVQKSGRENIYFNQVLFEILTNK
jgi:Fic family protein